MAFGSNRSGDWELWQADPDGSNAVQLTFLGAAQTGTPAWSPDGQIIVFDSNLEGHYEIYVVPASGGKPRRLTSHPSNNHVPSFSHDGKWIYFSSNRSGDDQIWKMPIAGGEPVQLTRNVGYVAKESVDGAFIYYTQTSRSASALWRQAASGGEPVKVVEGVVSRAFAVLEKGIYYLDELSGETRLQFLDFATSKSTTVASGLGTSQLGFCVSPDGRTILFSRLDSSVQDLMLVENFR